MITTLRRGLRNISNISDYVICARPLNSENSVSSVNHVNSVNIFSDIFRNHKQCNGIERERQS